MRLGREQFVVMEHELEGKGMNGRGMEPSIFSEIIPLPFIPLPQRLGSGPRLSSASDFLPAGGRNYSTGGFQCANSLWSDVGNPNKTGPILPVCPRYGTCRV